jgi:transcriptional regulator with XRE-family HTH domain
MKVTSPRTARDLRDLGENVAAMRKVHGLTAELLAERAGITRGTLRSIERGDGSAQLGNVMAVLRVLGLASSVVAATDPMATDLGRARMAEGLPQRVRTRT